MSVLTYIKDHHTSSLVVPLPKIAEYNQGMIGETKDEVILEKLIKKQ